MEAIRPPMDENRTDTTLVTDTESAAIATGVGEAKGFELCVACDVEFNISFCGAADVAETPTTPLNNGLFTPGVYKFLLNKHNTHYTAITPSAGGVISSWRAGYQ